MSENITTFLRRGAEYFENRPTGGEDMAHWANVYNAENMRKAADEIEKLRFENETLNKIAVRETVKVATLRTALKPFAECGPIELDDIWFTQELRIEDFRAAAAALKETGDEKL